MAESVKPAVSGHRAVTQSTSFDNSGVEAREVERSAHLPVDGREAEQMVAVPDGTSPLADGLRARGTPAVTTLPQPRRWESLFDGSVASWGRWKHAGAGTFELRDGALIARPPEDFRLGMAYFADRTFGDGVLKVVFSAQVPTDNSGVFVRMPAPPVDEQVPLSYEVNIHDVDPRPGHATGALYGFADRVPEARELKVADGRRHEMHIVLEQRRTRVYIDGRLVSSRSEGERVADGVRQQDDPPLEPERPARGYIGLQVHFPFYPYTTSDVRYYEVAWGALPGCDEGESDSSPR